MYREIVDQKISENLKAGNSLELSVWRSIKNEFLVYKTAKAGNEITDEVEVKLLSKMAAQRKDSMEQYRGANRNDLAKKEEAELNVILALLPKEASDEDIKNALNEFKSTKEDGYVFSMKDMKDAQTFVKSKFASVNGGKVAQIFRESI